MRYREYSPSPGLAAYVRYLWVFEREADDELFAYDRFLPEVGSYLVFQVDGACRRLDGGGLSQGVAALGNIRERIDVVFEGRTLNIGVRFTASGATMLGICSPLEVSGLVSYDLPWTSALLSRFRELRESLRREAPERREAPVRAGASSGANPGISEDLAPFASLLDEALLSRIRSESLDPLARLFDSIGTGSGPCAARLLEDHPLSRRSIERRCLEMTGYSPRELCALGRCGLARSALYLAAEPDLSDLALSLGYYDLPHFCRSFKRWGDMTPGEFSRFCQPYRTAMRGPDAMIHHSTDSLWLDGGRMGLAGHS